MMPANIPCHPLKLPMERLNVRQHLFLKVKRTYPELSSQPGYLSGRLETRSSDYQVALSQFRQLLVTGNSKD